MVLPLAIAVAGLAISAFGAYQSYSSAQDASAISQQQIALQQRAEAERRKAMELDARRRRLEVIRNRQRVSSIATARATSQNAQLGSALPGSLAQIGNQAGFNLLGINQNLEIGRNIFDINAQLSQQNIAMANAQSGLAFGNSLGSFGSTLMGSAETFGRLTSGFANPYASYTSSGGMGLPSGMGGSTLY